MHLRLPKTIHPPAMTHGQRAILDQLKAEGIPARISTTGWLLVSGRRTDWREAYWIGFLGWKRGTPAPKIVRTFYKESNRL